MNESAYKLEFEHLCRQSDLGKLANRPVPISGGLSHRIFAVETTAGKYAIKFLNPNIMSRKTALQNYMNSEKIASHLSQRIPALSAEKRDGTFIQNMDGQFYLVFKWCKGKSLRQTDIDTTHCKRIGGILAEIHLTDFSELEVPSERTDKGEPVDWNYYLQKGRHESAEWVEQLRGIIDHLEGWYTSAAEATASLSSNMVLSHRDLDPKNVLWLQYDPVLIDWESAGIINPLQDLIETAIYWAVNEAGRIDQQRFFSFVNGYKEKYGELHADWNMVLATGFSGKLGWLEYNLKRSLWIECADDEEQQMGTTQVIDTIREIRDYAEQIPILLRWLNAEQ